MTADSPIVEEVRKRRCEISQQFGHDVRAHAEHLREVQAKYGSRVVNQLTVVRSLGVADKGEMDAGLTPHH